MSATKTRALALAATAATAFGLAAAIPATAGDVATFPSRVTIREQAPAFHGRVFSDESACAVDRKVKLMRRRKPGRPLRTMGSDRTNMHGRWAVTEPTDFTLKSGIYFARAPEAIVSTPVSTVCAKDRSRKIVVD